MIYNFCFEFSFAHIYIYIYIELISLFPPLIIFPLNLQILDKNCLGPLRKAYCSSLNLLLRREVRDYNLFTHCIGIIFFISWSFGGKILVITLAFYELRSGHYSWNKGKTELYFLIKKIQALMWLKKYKQ